MNSLADGMYDVIVVEADERDDGTFVLHVAVTSGPHRGEVVAVHASGLDVAWTDLLAMPATLTVTDGQPALDL